LNGELPARWITGVDNLAATGKPRGLGRWLNDDPVVTPILVPAGDLDGWRGWGEWVPKGAPTGAPMRLAEEPAAERSINVAMAGRGKTAHIAVGDILVRAVAPLM